MKPVFLSYRRRTWLEEVSRLATSLRLRGMRVFHDVSDPEVLMGEPQFERLRSIIAQEASAFLLHVTRDLLSSNAIWEVEVPTALRRHESEPGFPVVPFFRDIMPDQVRDEMAPFGPRVSSFGGVVALPPADIANDALLRFIEGRHRAISTTLLSTLLSRSSHSGQVDMLRVGVQTREVTPGLDYPDLLLDWRSGYADAAAGDTLMPAIADVHSAIGKTPTRHLRIIGQAHLSAGLLLGASFSEAAGFRLEVLHRGDAWSTIGKRKDIRLRIVEAQSDPGCKDVLVTVGISRPELAASAERAMASLGTRWGARVVIEPHDGPSREFIQTDGQARSAVRRTTEAIMNSRARWGFGPIHLFISSPFALAVLLGHNLNALGPINVYEHDKASDTYCRAFVIS